jgi:hypothetical protein
MKYFYLTLRKCMLVGAITLVFVTMLQVQARSERSAVDAIHVTVDMESVHQHDTVQPPLLVTPKVLVFGVCNPLPFPISCVKSITIKNIGTSDRIIDYVKTRRMPLDAFTGEYGTFKLKPNESKTITITFRPLILRPNFYVGETTIVAGQEVVKVKLYGGRGIGPLNEQVQEPLQVSYYPNHPTLSTENPTLEYTVSEAGKVYISLQDVVTGRTTVVVNEIVGPGSYTGQLPEIKKGTYVLISKYNDDAAKKVRVVK